MPVHNAEKFLRDALDSVLADLPEGAELLVVDDGSKDGSADIIADAAAHDPRVGLLRNDTAVGVSNALNQGILHGACPDFVAVAEHDDVVLPGRFAAQLAALVEDDALGAVSSEGRYLGPKGTVAGRVSVGPKTHEEFTQMKGAGREILISHPAIMYRRDAVVGAGLYDEAFDSAQDLEIINRLVYAAGWEVRTLPGPHILYRIHDASMSFSHASVQRLMTRYIVQRNRAQLDGIDFPDFDQWRASNIPDFRTKWRWYRKDAGAVRYRQAGLAWLNRRPFAFLGNIIAASVLHPRWVIMKVRVARGR